MGKQNLTTEEQKWYAALGQRIERTRKDADLTQAELAKKTGLSQQMIARIEKGECLRLHTFFKICWVLGKDAFKTMGIKSKVDNP